MNAQPGRKRLAIIAASVLSIGAITGVAVASTSSDSGSDAPSPDRPAPLPTTGSSAPPGEGLGRAPTKEEAKSLGGRFDRTPNPNAKPPNPFPGSTDFPTPQSKDPDAPVQYIPPATPGGEPTAIFPPSSDGTAPPASDGKPGGRPGAR